MIVFMMDFKKSIRKYDTNTWLEKMTKIGQADMPILRVDGQILTPNDIVKQRSLSVKYKMDTIETDAYDYELLKERIREKHRRGTLIPIYSLPDETGMCERLNPDDILWEVENMTPRGMWVMEEIEQKFIEEVLKRVRESF